MSAPGTGRDGTEHAVHGGPTADVDVIVLGGGMAGLTGALQLKRMRPETRILLVDKRERPVEPTAFKVGESIAEVAAYYLKEVIGLEDYLRENHLRKMGLRMFCSADGNEDISRRVEFGLIQYTKLANYHLDRGRIENDLWAMAGDAGIELVPDTFVSGIELGEDDDPHTVSLGRGAGAREVRARWILDASGRVGLLRRKLGLGYGLPIDVNASWFRTPDRLELDAWSDDEAWRGWVPGGTRWKSTCSFVGRGYWIWIINLASGATSVGIVADPRFHPFERIRRYDAAIEWLREHEPQLAAHLPDTEDGLLDFGKLKRYSYGCTRAFSRRRWCVTGEAAMFLDPLYSTGHDFTAIGNTLATDVIARELDHGPSKELSARIRSHNRALLGIITLGISTFPGQLEAFGDPQSTGAKFVWDNASYFSILLLMFRNGLITDVDFLRSQQENLLLNARINEFTQDRFIEWSRDDFDARDAGIPICSDHLASILFTMPREDMSRDEVAAHIGLSVRRLATASREMTERMARAAGRTVPASAPYLDVEPVDEQLLMWADVDERAAPPERRAAQPADGWMVR